MALEDNPRPAGQPLHDDLAEANVRQFEAPLVPETGLTNRFSHFVGGGGRRQCSFCGLGGDRAGMEGSYSKNCKSVVAEVCFRLCGRTIAHVGRSMIHSQLQRCQHFARRGRTIRLMGPCLRASSCMNVFFFSGLACFLFVRCLPRPLDARVVDVDGSAQGPDSEARPVRPPAQRRDGVHVFHVADPGFFPGPRSSFM